MEWQAAIAREALLDGLEREVRRSPAVTSRLTSMRADVSAGRISPFRGARELLALFRK